jgi:broad specificity phosphatase PhoE
VDATALTDKDKLPKRIFLIRHARPDVSQKGLFNQEAASKFISDYDAAAVEEFVLEQETFPYKEVDKVYCSTLPRSQLTAKAIFGEQVQLKIDSVFREFERRIFSLPLLRLPIKLWLVSARVLWFLGFNNKDIETFKEAKLRARNCAETLAADATTHHTTVLVAHGLLNNFIRKELQAMGWQTKQNGGNGYLSVTLLQR